MKILFTGCTSKQTDDNAWQRARVKRIDDSTIFTRIGKLMVLLNHLTQC